MSIGRLSGQTVLYNGYQEKIVAAGLVASQFTVGDVKQQILEIGEVVLKAGLFILDAEFNP